MESPIEMVKVKSHHSSAAGDEKGDYLWYCLPEAAYANAALSLCERLGVWSARVLSS